MSCIVFVLIDHPNRETALLSSVKRIWDNVPNQNLGHFLTLFVFILDLEIIGVLLEVLDDMKVVPRVNHRPQPLLARLLRVDPAHLGWVGLGEVGGLWLILHTSAAANARTSFTILSYHIALLYSL